jgi:hypothetical protein
MVGAGGVIEMYQTSVRDMATTSDNALLRQIPASAPSVKTASGATKWRTANGRRWAAKAVFTKTGFPAPPGRRLRTSSRGMSHTGEAAYSRSGYSHIWPCRLARAVGGGQKRGHYGGDGGGNGATFIWSLSLLTGVLLQNGPEPSRARRCWVRRSEPFTARTVLGPSERGKECPLGA